MWKIDTKTEEIFFDFVAERIPQIGQNLPEPDPLDKEFILLHKQILENIDKLVWQRYELKVSLYYDQALYEAYKQGFIDALRLFASPKEYICESP